MLQRDDNFSPLCKGLAHELGNILTYLLPAVAEATTGQKLLAEALRRHQNGDAAALALPAVAEKLAPEDLARLDCQLQLAAARLQEMFDDLRRGFVTPAQERLRPMNLGQALRAALQVTATVTPVELYEPGTEPLWTPFEPELLREALARFLRAAAGWAECASAPVRLTLQALPGQAELCAHLVGDGALRLRPQELLSMLCPSESGALRSERGTLGVLVAAHLLQVHGGALSARQTAQGVELYATMPLCAAPRQERRDGS